MSNTPVTKRPPISIHVEGHASNDLITAIDNCLADMPQEWLDVISDMGEMACMGKAQPKFELVGSLTATFQMRVLALLSPEVAAVVKRDLSKNMARH
ncbi:hypothetical protein [Luteimonas sp. e5]